MAELRTTRLQNLFDAVLDGKKTVNLTNAKLFLESICEQSFAVTSISCLVSSQYGLDALLLALSCDTSLDFLNGQLTSFLECIKSPDLQTIRDGDVVRQILAKLMEAPLTWKSFVKAAQEHTLNQRALGSFAWLLFQLLSLPVKEAISYLSAAQDPLIQKALLKSPSYETRTQGRLIAKIAESLAGNLGSEELDLKVLQQNPGGRHDNDFAEIQKISIYPTPDELRTTAAYLPRPCDVEKRARESDGLASHIDCQFRLLREDMLCELREELAMFTQPKQIRRKPLDIWNLSLVGVYCGQRHVPLGQFSSQCTRSVPWCLKLRRKFGLPQLRGLITHKERKEFVKSRPNFLRNGSFVCLYVGDEFVTLATLVRDEDLLSKSILCVQLPARNLKRVLMQLKDASSNIRVVLQNCAIFAYEPVLRQLQKMKEFFLSPEIVAWQVGTAISPPDYILSEDLMQLLQDLKCADHSTDLLPCLGLKNSVSLDAAQAECFRSALQQKVALIQGPPGTGKSFIGALIGKAIHQSSDETILVVCYTHHALDDFLKDLLNLGIPQDDIIRLGSSQKATSVTKPLCLREQKLFFTLEQSQQVNRLKGKAEEEEEDLEIAFDQFASLKFSYRDILEFLSSRKETLLFYKAFQVPREKYGMIRVTQGGKKVGKYFLLNRWIRGLDAGMYKSQIPLECKDIWNLNPDIRNQKQQQWNHKMSKERVALVREVGKRHNDIVEVIDDLFSKRDLSVIRGKRIIACTTTAAAKLSKALCRISPGVLLVEEAGEILESHVLTALSPKTKHLILIGDHKQLRPKVSYELSVEKGSGYDLNRSLFERLILKGFPHQTLFTQHRMRPEISSFIREMTYPELEDAEDTSDRPNLLGFSDNIIFVNHSEPETELSVTREIGDLKATTSKQNRFEAQMTLKCVRYLGQQGYKTEDIVVLTPYLGQLRLLLDELSVDNDPWLNDLDSYDLARAGLMRDRVSSDDAEKPRLRISTIDNFQGEEANIVVASLTRSNAANDIGFMFAPERLNVLISRARNALILIGNAEHFMGSRKGSELWTRFIGLLKNGMHVYDGFPVRCERHPDRTTILQKPSDFDSECPAGGCKEPCSKVLNCGAHKCPDRCHLLSDHSQIKCTVPIPTQCSKGHANIIKCHVKKLKICTVCELEATKAREEAIRKFNAKNEEQQHSLKMTELDNEIERVMKEEASRNEAAKEKVCNDPAFDFISRTCPEVAIRNLNTERERQQNFLGMTELDSKIETMIKEQTSCTEVVEEDACINPVFGFISRTRSEVTVRKLHAEKEGRGNSLKTTEFDSEIDAMMKEQASCNEATQADVSNNPTFDSIRLEVAVRKPYAEREGQQNLSLMTEPKSKTTSMKKATYKDNSAKMANFDPQEFARRQILMAFKSPRVSRGSKARFQRELSFESQQRYDKALRKLRARKKQ